MPADQRLDPEAIRRQAQQLPAWKVEQERELSREFRFPDFAKALAFVNRVGELAEQANHHPDLTLGWGRVGVRLSTHSTGGLTSKDFDLAKKIGELPQ